MAEVDEVVVLSGVADAQHHAVGWHLLLAETADGHGVVVRFQGLDGADHKDTQHEGRQHEANAQNDVLLEQTFVFFHGIIFLLRS